MHRFIVTVVIFLSAFEFTDSVIGPPFRGLTQDMIDSITRRQSQRQSQIQSLQQNSKYIGWGSFILKWRDVKSMCDTEDAAFLIQGPRLNNTEDHRRSNMTQMNGNQFWIDLNQNLPSHEEIRFEFDEDHWSSPTTGMFCVEEDKQSNSDEDLIHRGRGTRSWMVYPNTGNINGEIDPFVHSYFTNSTNGTNFIGLKWEEVSFYQYVRLKSEQNGTIYVNETSSFICETEEVKVQFLREKDANLTFWVTFSNETKIMLKNGVPMQYRINEVSQKFQRFKSWRLNINLTIDVAAISCEFPNLRHPTLYFGAVKRIQPKYMQGPTLDRGNYEPELYFKNGETHKNLMCFSDLEPRPVYLWLMDGQVINELPELKLRPTIGNEGEEILEFPAIQKVHEGKYTCVATNKFGTDELHFYVSVTESGGHGLLTGLAVFLIIFGLAMCGIGLHRYYRAKKLMRGLTERELRDGSGIEYVRPIL